MKHSLKITAISLVFGFSAVSAMAQAQPAQTDLVKGFDLKPGIDKETVLLKRGRGRHGGGHGRGHDDDDESRGRNGGGSEESGRRRPRVPGGSGCDDPHDIAEHPECSLVPGTPVGGGGGGVGPGSHVSSVEVYPDGKVEIRYTNGWKEELENGRYELKNASNRTVVERRATAEDIARMNGLAGR